MLKKLTALSLSLLICLSMLPSQAGAMDAAEDEPGVRAEEQISPEDADAGIAPCQAECQDPLDKRVGGGLGAWDSNGAGNPIGGGIAGLGRP